MSQDKRKWYWRSLDEVEQTPEFEQFLHREFPEAASEFPSSISRRRWLQLMGASMALGAAGCRYEEEEIAPFARRPQNRVPGESRTFASVYEFAGVGYPLFVTSYDGRPVKVDGHRQHPETRGASTLFMQSCVLDLYDPDRSRSVKRVDAGVFEESSWDAFGESLAGVLAGAGDGSGWAILAQSSCSPSRMVQQKALLAKYPGLSWYEYEPAGSVVATGGTELAFGQSLRMQLSLEKAAIIVSLDADPIGDDAGGLKAARGWAAGRDVDQGKVNRLYAVESQMSTTGMAADHRLPLKSGQISGFVAALEAEVDRRLGLEGGGEVEGGSYAEKVLQAMAQDLVSHQGAGALVCGGRQSAEVQASVHRLNVKLGNVGADQPVAYAAVPSTADRSRGGISELVAGINAGSVSGILVLEGNPVYDAPADLSFADAYSKVAERVHLSLYANETSAASTWHLNLAHPLETWGDALAYDGSWCLAQPLIEPIWGGKSVVELLGWLTTGEPVDGADVVRSTAVSAYPELADENRWKQFVHDGWRDGSGSAAVAVGLVDFVGATASDSWKTATAESDVEDLELVVFPDSTIYDGRFANSGWLQECPDSVTKITWGNAALFAPSTAKQLGVKQNTMVKLILDGAQVEVPAHIQPGQARGSIGVAMGYGRTEVGVVGGSESQGIELVGSSVQPLVTTAGLVRSGLSLELTDRPHRLAVTQDHHAIDETGLRAINDRVGDLVRDGEWSDFKKFREDFDHWLEDHEGGHGHAHDEKSSGEGAGAPVAEEASAEDLEGGAGVDLLSLHEGEDHDHDHGHDHEHDGGAHHSWPYHHQHFENINLNDGPGYDGARWGMSIDLNKCTGCNACVVACQSENNVPIVGRDQVIRGREMHWLRIDRYYATEEVSEAAYDNPKVVTQPVACHHCENAPCEQVCPVAATVHSDEGLNDMVYNRCIGTRYCGNNCPYKVRRFNYLNYTEAVTFLKYPWADKLSKANRALRNLVMNPEVTVRSRGVMEKCTYCVQRIQNTKIKARREGNRPIGPDEITTACQDACPTEAIAFGDLENKSSRVAAEQGKARAYSMLGELNVRPRTMYLARVRNSHESLVPSGSGHGDH